MWLAIFFLIGRTNNFTPDCLALLFLVGNCLAKPGVWNVKQQVRLLTVNASLQMVVRSQIQTLIFGHPQNGALETKWPVVRATPTSPRPCLSDGHNLHDDAECAEFDPVVLPHVSGGNDAVREGICCSVSQAIASTETHDGRVSSQAAQALDAILLIKLKKIQLYKNYAFTSSNCVLYLFRTLWSRFTAKKSDVLTLITYVGRSDHYMSVAVKRLQSFRKRDTITRRKNVIFFVFISKIPPELGLPVGLESGALATRPLGLVCLLF